jgi:hypothetical protein
MRNLQPRIVERLYVTLITYYSFILKIPVSEACWIKKTVFVNNQWPFELYFIDWSPEIMIRQFLWFASTT